MENKEIEEDNVEVVGIQTICRICANQNERLIGIFSEEGISNDLATKINLYLPIKVAISDELPLQCCWNCASTLLAWHELVLTSVETDRKLQNSQFIFEKQLIEDSGAFEEAGTAAPSDSDGPLSTSLNDFCQTELSPSKKPAKPSKRKKKQEIAPFYPPQEADPLATYITDMEHQLIDPELPEHPDLNEYKIDIEENQIIDEESKPQILDTSDDSMSMKGDRDENINSYFACRFCTAIFVLKKDVLRHLQAEHAGQECDEIPIIEQMPDLAQAKKEKRQHTKLDREVINAAKVVVEGRIYYNCKECGKSLHSPYTYIWHMRIHTGERPYVCDLCGKQFRVSQGLVRHLRETHQGIKKFPCDLCGRMFATRRNVEEHRRIHTNERPYVCDLCGKSFKQKASLFVHKRSHKNYFPFKCSYCNQGFRTKPPLMVHITRHTGEKPYKCDICGRSFRIKYELKRHRLIHSDEKPWVCNICGLSFRQKRYLRNHTKSNHTPTLPTT